MPVEQVTVPAAGESITEATLNRWFKPDGSFVKADEPLFEMGTDKASQEVVAPVSGVVKHLVKEGATVAIGAVVAQIDTDATVRMPTSKAQPSGAVPVPPTREAPKSAPAASGVASPAAARVLAEAGVKAEDVKGTGRDGRITKGDALEAAQGLGGKGPATEEKAPPTVNGSAKPT